MIRCLPIAALLTALLATPVGADVVSGPSQGYSVAEPFNSVALVTSYRTPNGIFYHKGLGPEYGVTTVGISWEPKNEPVAMAIGRDANGFWLGLDSLIRTPDQAWSCHTEIELTAADALSATRLWRKLNHVVRAWAAACGSTRAFGSDRIVAKMDAILADFERAHRRFSVAAKKRLLPSTRGFALPSFLPSEVSQPLLDAIAEGCELPRANLRLEQGGRIALRELISDNVVADARVNLCATDAIRYLPGAAIR